ncbi:hypothetical protein P4S83_18855 [Aneurinibacillus thermoaerophilus]|uniref:hypothetical protein n=1 Tax=Aneurinibacillus thermoaerophilus TaxID=143495 RepID=UPI002E1CF0C1|nr:hypothetical protein [Aneurinibacillus thermoaerophilus]MED0766329.1 hypothetical protein [Aneurinibacillus thermoaerophilus]
MDAVTLSQVLEQLKRTGKNTDAAGNTTLFAYLKQINDYVDTLETKVADLKYHLGNITDLANRNGSLQSKVVDIRNVLDTSVAKWPTTKRLYVNPANTAGAWQWLFDSGVGTKGRLQTFKFHLSSFTESVYIEFQIWVDGYLISHVKLSGSSSVPTTIGFSTPEILTKGAGYKAQGGGYVIYQTGASFGSFDSVTLTYGTKDHSNILLHLPWNNRLEIKYLITGSFDFKEAVIIYEQA